ncbi:MAG: hypothetical protein ACKOU6_14530, partial [Planctomycetota bacterium]
MALSNPSSPPNELRRNPSPPLVQRLLEIRRLGIRQMALGLLACLLVCGGWKVAAAADPTFAQIVASVQPKVVKIYGAGGIKGLEAYQSGFLISAEGPVLTAWSFVLDNGDDAVTVLLDDGRRFRAKLGGAEPRR